MGETTWTSLGAWALMQRDLFHLGANFSRPYGRVWGHPSTLERVTKLLIRNVYIGEQVESRDNERLEWEENLQIDKQKTKDG